MTTMPDCLLISMLASRAAPGLARTLAKAHLYNWGYMHISDDASLVISELITNAAAVAPHREIRFQISRDVAGCPHRRMGPQPAQARAPTGRRTDARHPGPDRRELGRQRRTGPADHRRHRHRMRTQPRPGRRKMDMGPPQTLTPPHKLCGVRAPDREAMPEMAPRHLFLPDLIWPLDPDTGRYPVVDRVDDPVRWRAWADADTPIVTQWDDGRHAGPAPGRTATSSSSEPSLVAGMLTDLDVRPGQRVLDVGAGTGWTTALLTACAGGRGVVGVELDPEVAGAARARLRAMRRGRAGRHRRRCRRVGGRGPL